MWDMTHVTWVDHLPLDTQMLSKMWTDSQTENQAFKFVSCSHAKPHPLTKTFFLKVMNYRNYLISVTNICHYLLLSMLLGLDKSMKMFRRLQIFGLTLSRPTTLDAVDDMTANFDKKIKGWQSAVSQQETFQVFHLTVRCTMSVRTMSKLCYITKHTPIFNFIWFFTSKW